MNVSPYVSMNYKKYIWHLFLFVFSYFLQFLEAFYEAKSRYLVLLYYSETYKWEINIKERNIRNGS